MSSNPYQQFAGARQTGPGAYPAMPRVPAKRRCCKVCKTLLDNQAQFTGAEPLLLVVSAPPDGSVVDEKSDALSPQSSAACPFCSADPAKSSQS